MDIFFAKLKAIFKDRSLRKRLMFILGALILFRAMAVVPIPGVDEGALQGFLSDFQFFGLLDVFTGGGLANLSIVMLGVGPYITAVIIMQLLTIMSPKLKALYHEEGQAGRRKFNQYGRLLTVPLAVIQAFGFMALLRGQGVLGEMTIPEQLINVIVITAGSILLMWIGELITEFGIGNGVSIIIFAGIVANLPGVLAEVWFARDISEIPLYLAVLAATVLVTLGVVIITEAERPIPVTYAKRVRGQKVYGGISTYLPLRLNQAGVIPIIFGLSILLFPQMIFNFLQTVDVDFVRNIAGAALRFFDLGIVFSSFYFLLVFGFTYFYTAVTFDPDSISTNLQKSGAFIPGVRPGQTTSAYIAKILTRLTLVGALFLGTIAVLPLIMQFITNNPAFAIGGTGLLITVSVVIDLIKKIDAQISLREY